MFNMNDIVGKNDIVFITLDTLRLDVAKREMAAGRLPVLGQYITGWEERHSPASFTYAAHHAFFAGFLPTPINKPTAERLLAVDFQGSTSISNNTKCFNSSTIVEGLAQEGYHTICIGGVGFFNKRTPLGCVLPGLFQDSYWHEKMGVTDSHSTENQVEQAVNVIREVKSIQDYQPVFLFINVSAIHQPNYFYLDSATSSDKTDTIDSHAAALRYVDKALAPLFDECQQHNDTLVIMCSDHGTTYGEDGYTGHRLAHENVWKVPYAEFLMEAKK